MSSEHAGYGRALDSGPEPSLAERARTLVSMGRIGTLSTQSRKFEGFAFGSMMPYASDRLGQPVFFVSTMAMHTQNLQADWRASLLVMQPDAEGDPLGAARVTLLGNVEQVAAEEVRKLYLDYHPNARQWQDYSDFSFYRLYPNNIYYIGGFGVMGWISGEDYVAAAPDPLAPFAKDILEHMNADHADAVALIARCSIGADVDEAEMTAVDRLGFSVRLRTGEETHGRRIPFLNEVRDTEEARKQLVEMVRIARQS